ncbi:MAG: trigger factor [Phycisphaerales bacterium]|nr:trigger factor [Phycisphaerales bacterium]
MDSIGQVPGVDPEALEKYEARSEKLLEELKSAVQATARDVGMLRKELTVTVPAEVITAHMQHNYDELMHDAFVPGFRKGRAPRQLVEKRFGADVRESLKTMVVGQSFYAAVDKEKIEPLGDPLFRIAAEGGDKLVDIGQALTTFKLPEDGDFTYVCEVELRPQFELPELKGIPVRNPTVTITDEMAAEELLKRRKIQGRMEPVSGPATESDDQVIADVTLTVDGQEVKTEDNVVLGVRPSRLDGVTLMNLGEALRGAAAGEVRETECTIPDDYERTDLRGKSGTFTFRIHEVKRLVPVELDAFLKDWGFDNEAEALSYMKDQLEAERDRLVQSARRGQVEQYLLEKTQLDLPEGFSARQVDRAVMRKVIDLHQRGIPMSEVEARIDALRTSAQDEVRTELKLAFIMAKIAEDRGIEVTDEEVNAEIARIARSYGQRFDRIRDDLQTRGLLDQLVEELRHGKCVAELLAEADIQDVAAAAPASEPA